MTGGSVDENRADALNLSQHPLWLRIVKLRRRLWFAFLLFLLVPFSIAIATGSDALAMVAAAAIVLIALWTARQVAQAECPSCGNTYFAREKNGRRIYNNFTGKCMSCGWSETQPNSERTDLKA
jgi:predicted RNA-binding Zn-ribbon protein involved in translation (DUF1610 family)